MEPKTVIYPSWEEIVVQHRQRAYNAYLRRKQSARRLVLGIGVSVSMIALMDLLPPAPCKTSDEIRATAAEPIVLPGKKPPQNEISASARMILPIH